MSQITPEAIVEFVRGQEDLHLSTLTQEKPFVVRAVDDGLEYIPATKKPRLQHRKWLTRVCDEFNRVRSMHPGDYSHLTFNSSYTLAVIDAYLKTR